jgi:hypothetical protein
MDTFCSVIFWLKLCPSHIPKKYFGSVGVQSFIICYNIIVQRSTTKFPYLCYNIYSLKNYCLCSLEKWPKEWYLSDWDCSNIARGVLDGGELHEPTCQGSWWGSQSHGLRESERFQVLRIKRIREVHARATKATREVHVIIESFRVQMTPQPHNHPFSGIL